jgi:sirohydrochlorin cobaltochelatase
MKEPGGSRNLTQALARWLAEGRRQIGQIAIQSSADGFELRHVHEMDCIDLETHRGITAARHLANLDDAESYRPLKTAPNLRHGWRLILCDIDELRVALDYFYPAMLGVALSHERGELQPVPLRETLGRQTGMYRVTQKITDAQARSMIDSFCSGCLKCRLWDGQVPEQPPQEFPLLCHEACNLLVAEARRLVKAEPR